RLPAAEKLGDLVAQVLGPVLGELLVAVPPDSVLGAWLADDELVLRRAAGVLAGVDHHRAALAEPRFAAGDRVLVEDGRRRVPDDDSDRVDAVYGEIHPTADVHRRHRILPFHVARYESRSAAPTGLRPPIVCTRARSSADRRNRDPPALAGERGAGDRRLPRRRSGGRAVARPDPSAVHDRASPRLSRRRAGTGRDEARDHRRLDG